MSGDLDAIGTSDGEPQENDILAASSRVDDLTSSIAESAGVAMATGSVRKVDQSELDTFAKLVLRPQKSMVEIDGDRYEVEIRHDCLNKYELIVRPERSRRAIFYKYEICHDKNIKVKVGGGVPHFLSGKSSKEFYDALLEELKKL